MSYTQGAVLLHGCAAAIMAYGYRSLHSLPIDSWISTQKGGHFQYLTIQGLVVAWFTMVASLVGDIFPSLVAIKKIKRSLLMIALPLAVVIESIYWTLLFLCPSLILQTDPVSEPSSPAVLTRVPLRIDLALHAVPGLTLVADFMFLEFKFSKNEARYGATFVVAMASVWYACWVEYCAIFNGIFPYPFLTANPLEIRVGIYAAAATLALISFWTINGLHPRQS